MSTPVGPYSPAVRAGPWLVCSGQIGIEPGAEGPCWWRAGSRTRRARPWPTWPALLAGRGARAGRTW